MVSILVNFIFQAFAVTESIFLIVPVFKSLGFFFKIFTLDLYSSTVYYNEQHFRCFKHTCI